MTKHLIKNTRCKQANDICFIIWAFLYAVLWLTTEAGAAADTHPD